jgi:hypothetical protein
VAQLPDVVGELITQRHGTEKSRARARLFFVPLACALACPACNSLPRAEEDGSSRYFLDGVASHDGSSAVIDPRNHFLLLSDELYTLEPCRVEEARICIDSAYMKLYVPTSGAGVWHYGDVRFDLSPADAAARKLAPDATSTVVSRQRQGRFTFLLDRSSRLLGWTLAYISVAGGPEQYTYLRASAR